MGGRWLWWGGAVLTSLNRWPPRGWAQGRAAVSSPSPAQPLLKGQRVGLWHCYQGALAGSPPWLLWRGLCPGSAWEVRDQGAPGPRRGGCCRASEARAPAAVWAQEQGHSGGAAGRVPAEPGGGGVRGSLLGRWGQEPGR